MHFLSALLPGCQDLEGLPAQGLRWLNRLGGMTHPYAQVFAPRLAGMLTRTRSLKPSASPPWAGTRLKPSSWISVWQCRPASLPGGCWPSGGCEMPVASVGKPSSLYCNRGAGHGYAQSVGGSVERTHQVGGWGEGGRCSHFDLQVGFRIWQVVSIPGDL